MVNSTPLRSVIWLLFHLILFKKFKQPPKILILMQTILGAGGPIGIALAGALRTYTDQIRLVSRNPKTVNPTDQLFSADLSDPQQVSAAVAGSEIVYVVIGFPYSSKIWREKWPAFMRSVIAACQEHGAKLVFFDNIYMYDRDRIGHMTEATPFRPTSKKGLVRAEVAQMVLDAISSGRLNALIARSADFYGPYNPQSVLVQSVIMNFKKGKPANWFARIDKVHNFTFTPDAGRATAQLGNTPDAFNQVWHLPTNRERLTINDWINKIATLMEVTPKVQVLPTWAMLPMGWFIPILREFQEMIYQFDRDYYFDSSKFTQRFGWEATPIEEGLRISIDQN